MVCPNCKTNHENVRGKCPRCGADFHGYGGGRCAVQPRELRKVASHRCSHGILRHWPCTKCYRSDAEIETYKQSILAQIKELLIRGGVNKSEAWERSKEMLAAIDLWEARKELNLR